MSKELVEEAKEGHGISRRTLERAKKKAGVEAYRNENPGPWYWRLDHTAKQNASFSKGEELGDLGGVPQNPQKTGFFDEAEDHTAKLSVLGGVVDDGHESTDDADDEWGYV